MSVFNLGRHIPKGIVKNNSLIIKNGKGCWIWDKNNKKYLDMTSGIGALSTGHSHPQVIDNVRIQLGFLVHGQQNCFYSHNQHIALVKKLLKILPEGHDTIYFTNSGTEATENAIKVARMTTKKNNIIVMNRGFHGRSLGAMALSSSKVSYRQGFQSLLSGVFFCNNYTKEEINKILNNQTSPDETCAIILEPVLGEGGIHYFDESFVKFLREICTKHNIKLIFDEVQSGSGRTGRWWASDKWNISPDIMTFAKGIGSGFPIGGISGNSSLFDLMSKNSLGGTYNGNAISCAASNATIDIINNEKLLQNANDRGKELSIYLEKLPYVKAVRQYGLFIGVDLIEDIKVQNVIKKSLRNKLILLSCGDNTIRILPPLIISKKEVEIFIDRLSKTLYSF